MQINWTGFRSPGGLLYAGYDNLADVFTDQGDRLGEILKTPEGKFDVRTASQVQLGVEETEDGAIELLSAHQIYGNDWNGFCEWKRTRA